MKNITALTLVLSMAVISGCSSYAGDPDFQFQLASRPALSSDSAWLPRRERYTQRFTWKMRHIAKNLRRNLKEWKPSETTVLMTTIVPIDDLSQATRFGRLCTEQLITELDLQGFKVIEARKTESYLMRDKQGEFSLSRDPRWLAEEFNADVVVVGVYTKSGNQTLINVRMVSAKDARVLAATSAMMNLKGDRFLAGMFSPEKKSELTELKDSRGIRIRKRVLSEIDSPAEILESQVGNMAGDIAGTAFEKAEGFPEIAVATFVDMDNFYRATSFGRYLTEQLIAEFKSLGFNVIEVRLSPELFVDIRIGELGLTREMSQLMMNKKADALVVGTYNRAGDNITVSARLVIRGARRVAGVGRMIVDASSKNKFVTAMLENEVTTVAPTETIEGF
ncbi:hypothetical protein MNBD_NITROSPINAE03-678 [hydrothermal vent metagenome]|uniref:FlgO domain-containing protein n=1 Tax=hydrothermal vent metagenome TaxID=652676 RepID=A0A3B1BTP3_9ZZZZ